MNLPLEFMMTRLISFVTLIVSALSVSAAVSFSGTAADPVTVVPAASTGLEAVYVVDGTDGVKISYTPSSPAAHVEWTSYTNRGAAYGTPVPYSIVDGACVIDAAADDSGYLITDNGRQTAFYVINYDNHALSFDAVTYSRDESDCSRMALSFSGSAAPITYYTINGRNMELSREIELRYTTLVYDESTSSFVSEEKTETFESVGQFIRVTTPYCPTVFTLTGDRFLSAWNRAVSIESDMITPTAVDGHTTAVQVDRDNDNEQSVEAALGGSGPVDITFTAAVTDAAIFREWQFCSSPEFDLIDLRFNDLEFTYTFRESGTTYVRFVAANDDASCEFYSETYEVMIGESALECPNAFSPGSTPGINDEWKVSYKSIVSFECHIFNRWGVKLATLTDPSQGWDGKKGGKVVPAGVYYYVIKARGADGRNYNLSGDINIINYRAGANQSPVE